MLRCRTDGSQDSLRRRRVARSDGRGEAPMTILEQGPVLAIVRYRAGGNVWAALEVLADAGIPLLEVTVDTPGALDAVRTAADAGRTIGVGTVTTPDQVRASRDAGASFVVSPGCLPDVIGTALEVGIEPIPGTLSATELQIALRAGATAVKIFPAAPVGGPGYIRALRGPFPDVPMLPTGGIEPQDVPGYLDAGATCVGLGSILVGADPPASAADIEGIATRAATVMGVVRG
jgi:2-dehydro-3-deoxyphosphogluconate aldolase / (4S)-4-hydroxy-2-oxoglutarate aldolase